MTSLQIHALYFKKSYINFIFCQYKLHKFIFIFGFNFEIVNLYFISIKKFIAPYSSTAQECGHRRGPSRTDPHSKGLMMREISESTMRELHDDELLMIGGGGIFADAIRRSLRRLPRKRGASVNDALKRIAKDIKKRLKA